MIGPFTMPAVVKFVAYCGVATGLRLHALAQRAQDAREKDDYEAIKPRCRRGQDNRRRQCELIAAVEHMLERQ